MRYEPKKRRPMAGSDETTQEFLDAEQYRSDAILRYEQVYGEDFVSPGGIDMARELIARLALAPGARVLDVGCGLGGSAFVMAREFGLEVDGIDLSKNMLEIAARKLAARGLEDRVSLEWGDCLELNREGAYDAVYSRDVFLHIHDKARLFAVLHTALRPGGRLLFTDYCCGPAPWGDAFTAYVEDRGYDLHTPEDYARLVADAGFRQVADADITARFVDILRAELVRMETLGIEAEVRDKLAAGWRQKLDRALGGDHRWGLFTALK
jgi:phosphoethanolamine N-methyltransferase